MKLWADTPAAGEQPQRLQRISRELDPRAFFAGVILGVALCVFLGHQAARQNIYGDRDRFFRFISPAAGVYPTPDNLYQFVRNAAPRDKILVLVAGNSTLLGYGQTEKSLWSHRLQEDLGKDFAVVNVSFRAVEAPSMALPLLERLGREYPHMYLVTNTEPTMAPGWLLDTGTGTPPYPYDYFLWESRIMNVLDASPERDAQFREALFSGDRAFRRESQELFFRAVFDHALRAADLWNLIGYRYFFTVWSDTTILSEVPSRKVPFWVPRRSIPDDERPDASFPPVEERFRDFTGVAKNVIFGLYVDKIRQEGSRLRLESDQAVPAVKTIAEKIPAWRRKQVLFLVLSRASGFVNRLTPDQRMRYDLAITDWTSMLEGQGFRAMPLGLDYPAGDYIDNIHFSSAAGVRMGAGVAAKLREMAARDGWLKP